MRATGKTSKGTWKPAHGSKSSWVVKTVVVLGFASLFLLLLSTRFVGCVINPELGCDEQQGPKPWFEQYMEIHQRNMQSGKPKFMLYSFADPAGWGNRLRVLYTCALMSLLTDRILITVEPDYLLHFHTPKLWIQNGISVNASDYHLEGKSRVRIPDLEQWKFKDFVMKASLADFTEKYADVEVLEFGEAYAFDFQILENPIFKEALSKYFSRTDSRIWIFQEVLSFLLSNPEQKFLRIVHDTKIRMNWTSVDHVFSVQLRAWSDFGLFQERFREQHAGYLNDAVSIYKNDYLLHYRGSSYAMFYCSDDPQYYHDAKEILSQLHCPVVFSPFEPKHTSYDGWGHIKGAIVDWYLLGESAELITTGTSYSITARARTKNLFGVYILGPEAPDSKPTKLPYKNRPGCGDICI